MSDWNNKIIEEFRANEGRIGGPFEGAPLLLLHTVGARTGQERVNPMMYLPVDGGYAVFASKAGAVKHPSQPGEAGRNPQRQRDPHCRRNAVPDLLAGPGRGGHESWRHSAAAKTTPSKGHASRS